MPTQTWIAQRKQITFWIETEKADRFTAACERQGRTASSVLRETVDLMLETEEEGNDGQRE